MMNKRLKKIVTCIARATMLVICGCGSDMSTSTTGTNSNQTQAPTKALEAEATKPTSTTGGSMTLVVEGKYTVYDPDNTRGLSTTGQGWRFGYATNGQPHFISIKNQKRFDSLKSKGIEALTLDTKSEGKVLYLTFDCGYEYNNNTSKILDVLKAKNEKAAFFCTKPFITGYGNVVQRMIGEGHIVGNHSTTHPVFTKISRTQMAEELWGVSSILKSKYNYDCKYFRFPAGENSESSLELVTSQGYKSIFWSMAHVDWNISNQPAEADALATVTERLHPGAVILLHTVSNTNVAILDDFFDAAHARGYTFVTLDDYKWN